MIKIQWLASIWRQNDQKCWVTSQNIQTQRKTTKPIKLQWIASIGCQNDQNKAKAKLRKWSKSNDLHQFDVKTIKNVELRRKTFKTTQNYKTYQFTMNCIDWMSKHQTNAELQKWSYFDEFASIWHQNDQIQRKSTKVIKLQWIASIWRQTI